MDYKKAGVDIEAGYKSVELMKKHVQSTMREEVLTNIGGFSGAFSMKKFKDMENPTLVSGTDGVGTKLKLAFIMDTALWSSSPEADGITKSTSTPFAARPFVIP